ncbi:putative holin-like toxin [Cytobacillus oceanisediminis]
MITIADPLELMIAFASLIVAVIAITKGKRVTASYPRPRR